MRRHAFALALVALVALAGIAGVGEARIRPADMKPLVGANYAPSDKDEKGLWDQLGRVEEELASSNLRVRDPALNAYVKGVLDRVAGPDVHARLYIVRSPDFNAGMYPNGMMVVNSGLLTRIRNEAQLAAVLGHETGHFLRQHQIRQWRDLRRRAAVMNFVGLGLGLGGIAAGVDTSDIVRSINNALFLGIFAYQRDMESEADAMSLELMQRAGYAPEESSAIWRQMIGERDASAKARGKRPKRGYSVFDSHPTNEQRMIDMAASAKDVADGTGQPHRAEFVRAVASQRPWLLDDQVKLNDPGASLYILDAQAGDGWDGLLRFERAEVYRLRGADGDARLAADDLAGAVTLPGAPPEAYRAQGYAMIKAGKAADGKAALTKYLTLAPAAKDAAMVRYTIEQ